MLVPEDGTSMRKWRISTRRYTFLKTGLWAVVFFLCAGFVSMGVLTYMVFQVRRYQLANEELLNATSKIEIIAGRLAAYEEKERKLRTILGADLDLPQAMTVEEYARTFQGLEDSTITGMSGIDQAITREESKVRRIPTIWPVNPWQITKEFKYTGNPRVDHLGIDILSWGSGRSEVMATADGEVLFADMSKNLGRRIVIDHGNGWVTEYGHNSSLLVKYGDTVRKGQTIALFGGEGGASSGPHLHYAMFYNKQPINPLEHLDTTKLAKSE